METLQDNITSPFNSIRDATRFASFLSHSSFGAPTTLASDDGLTIYFHSKQFHIPTFRTKLAGLQQRLEGLFEDLCGDKDIYPVLPQGAKDDWANTDRGYSFQSHLPSSSTLLIERLCEDKVHPLWVMPVDGPPHPCAR